MFRFALTSLAIVATACMVFADDPKAKVKARAAAALALAKAADAAKIAAKAPLNDLEKAKLKAIADSKPLVVWVGDAPKDVAKRAPSAIHVVVDRLAGTDAKCVVFDCRGEKCEQRSSVKEYPSPSLLKTLLEDLPTRAPQAKASAPEFFITADLAPAEAEEADAPPVKTRKVWREVCENGVCRWVEVTEPVPDPAPAPTASFVWATPSKAAASDDGCPCVTATGSCPCAARGQPVRARVQAVRGWWQERPRLFSFAPLFARFHR